jgi:hypothetical protein
MSFAVASINADTLALLGDWGSTVTFASATWTVGNSSAGDASAVWAKVTSVLGDIQDVALFRNREGITVDVGGQTYNVAKIAFTGSVTGAAAGQRLYEGTAVTTTATHWFVARIGNDQPGHFECPLLEKGPSEP